MLPVVIAIGLFLLLVAAGAAVPLLDQGLLAWLAENADCNDRRCTEEEMRTVLTAVLAGAGGLGAILLAGGVVGAVRRREEAPSLSGLGADGEGYEGRMEALARLDEAYGRGQVPEERYQEIRDRLMGGARRS